MLIRVGLKITTSIIMAAFFRRPPTKAGGCILNGAKQTAALLLGMEIALEQAAATFSFCSAPQNKMPEKLFKLRCVKKTSNASHRKNWGRRYLGFPCHRLRKRTRRLCGSVSCQSHQRSTRCIYHCRLEVRAHTAPHSLNRSNNESLHIFSPSHSTRQ